MIIHSSFIVKVITFGFAQGIAIFPFIFIRNGLDKEYEPYLINHEKIHIKQQKELFLIGFFVLYVAWFLIDYLFGFNFKNAYLKIPFECEAYSNQFDVEYLTNRKRFDWKSYI